MILKILSIAIIAVPIFLALRAVLWPRRRAPNPQMQQLKREVDFAISIFIFLVICVTLYALFQMVWV